MTENQLALLIQTAAVVAAVLAAIIALVLGAQDRRNARVIAARDRRFHQLMVENARLARLLENYNRGGSTNPEEVSRMGAEALTLVGLIGPERLPKLWKEKVDSESKLRELLDDPQMPDWKKDAIDVQLAVLANGRDLEAATS